MNGSMPPLGGSGQLMKRSFSVNCQHITAGVSPLLGAVTAAPSDLWTYLMPGKKAKKETDPSGSGRGGGGGSDVDSGSDSPTVPATAPAPPVPFSLVALLLCIKKFMSYVMSCMICMHRSIMYPGICKFCINVICHHV